jgi:hypothetical protein
MTFLYADALASHRVLRCRAILIALVALIGGAAVIGVVAPLGGLELSLHANS